MIKSTGLKYKDGVIFALNTAIYNEGMEKVKMLSESSSFLMNLCSLAPMRIRMLKSYRKFCKISRKLMKLGRMVPAL